MSLKKELQEIDFWIKRNNFKNAISTADKKIIKLEDSGRIADAIRISIQTGNNKQWDYLAETYATPNEYLTKDLTLTYNIINQGNLRDTSLN